MGSAGVGEGAVFAGAVVTDPVGADELVEHYNGHRPHRALGLVAPEPRCRKPGRLASDRSSVVMYSPDSSTNTTWSRDVIDFWNPTRRFGTRTVATLAAATASPLQSGRLGLSLPHLIEETAHRAKHADSTREMLDSIETRAQGPRCPATPTRVRDRLTSACLTVRQTAVLVWCCRRIRSADSYQSYVPRRPS